MDPLLTISELAGRTGFTASALRYYEQVGLLTATQRSRAQALVRIAELSAFAAQLEQAEASLSSPAPSDPCGPGCGCAAGRDGQASPDRPASPQFLELSVTRPATPQAAALQAATLQAATLQAATA